MSAQPRIKMVMRNYGDRYDGCYLNLADLRLYMDWLAETSGEEKVANVLSRFDQALTGAIIHRKVA